MCAKVRFACRSKTGCPVGTTGAAVWPKDADAKRNGARLALRLHSQHRLRPLNFVRPPKNSSQGRGTYTQVGPKTKTGGTAFWPLSYTTCCTFVRARWDILCGLPVRELRFAVLCRNSGCGGGGLSAALSATPKLRNRGILGLYKFPVAIAK